MPGRNESCPCGSGKKYKRCCAELAHRPNPAMGGLAAGRAEAEAQAVLGASLQERRRYHEAVKAYRRALELEPRMAEVHNNLGNAELELGRPDEAVQAYERALDVAPADAEIASNLGNALRLTGQLERSASLCRRALALDPRLAAAHNNLGLTLARLGRFDEAIDSYRRALALDPTDIHALDNLGNALRDRGDLGQAVMCFRAAIELRPDHGASHYNLGNALLDWGRIDEAGESYRRALELNPADAAARLTLSMVLRRQGRAAEAEQSCRAALALRPDSAETLAFLGELSADQGDFNAARELFERAVRLDPNLANAWSGIAAHRRMTIDDDAWLRGATTLVDKPLPLRHAIGLRYALGKYFDDTERFDAAFDQYSRANELTKRYGAIYDRDRLRGRVDALIAGLDGAWLRRRTPHGHRSERPVFIIGMPRSGTSLTEQILASHPQVFGAGEQTFWEVAFAQFEAAGNTAVGGQGDDAAPAGVGRDAATGLGCDAAARLIAGMAERYLERLANLSPEAARVVDKLPWNFMNAGLIHAAFPRARFIHLQRHPVDTCLSIYFQYFANALPYANDLDDLAHYYGEYSRLMQHWRNVLPPQSLLDVPYELLVQDPEAWTRRLLDFVDLPWDPRCLESHRTKRVVTTVSKWQVRQRIHASSIARWKNYRRHLGPLARLV
jgi:tetratricopeptide (TPR) repeat protein